MDHIRELSARYPALEPVLPDLEVLFHVMRDSFASGGKLLVCGNGGSAADALHIAGELSKGFIKKRPLTPEAVRRFDALPPSLLPPDIAAALKNGLQRGLPVVPLTSQTALLTAVINDSGAELMYAQQVCVFGAEGDVFLGISTSGNAKNVLYAALTARAFGLKTAALTGRTGGALARIADVCVRAPADETHQIQEYHLPLYHALCLALEERFFPC